jgi:hypothetical protein
MQSDTSCSAIRIIMAELIAHIDRNKRLSTRICAMETLERLLVQLDFQSLSQQDAVLVSDMKQKLNIDVRQHDLTRLDILIVYCRRSQQHLKRV